MSLVSIVYANSNYSEVMAVFEHQYRKYCNIPLCRISDTDGDHTYSNSEPYYQHWLKALSRIREDYFIYNQDDFFLYADVDSEKIYELVETLHYSPWSYIRLIKSGINLSEAQPDLGEPNLYIVGEESHPQYSMQATIWKKSVFMNMYELAAQEKWFECNEYTNVCRRLGISGLYYYEGERKRGSNHFDSSIYPYTATAIVGGKWNMREYGEELSGILPQFDIDPNERGLFS